jgi:nicotinamidase-related amidase
MMKRARLVIDVQNEYFEGGLLPVTHPHAHFENILRVMDGAMATGVPVVIVRHTFVPPEMPFFKRGTPGWEMHLEVASRPCDHWVEKELPGSFTGTGLEEWLRQREIDTVTVAGYMTHMCCDTTSRQALHRR